MIPAKIPRAWRHSHKLMNRESFKEKRVSLLLPGRSDLPPTPSPEGFAPRKGPPLSQKRRALQNAVARLTGEGYQRPGAPQTRGESLLQTEEQGARVFTRLGENLTWI